jgi:anti-sigma-K factor RskA
MRVALLMFTVTQINERIISFLMQSIEMWREGTAAKAIAAYLKIHLACAFANRGKQLNP